MLFARSFLVGWGVVAPLIVWPCCVYACGSCGVHGGGLGSLDRLPGPQATYRIKVMPALPPPPPPQTRRQNPETNSRRKPKKCHKTHPTPAKQAALCSNPGIRIRDSAHDSAGGAGGMYAAFNCSYQLSTVGPVYIFCFCSVLQHVLQLHTPHAPPDPDPETKRISAVPYSDW